MRDFHDFDESVLLEMLADYTNRHTKLLLQFTKERRYIECKEMIDAILSEIDNRRAMHSSIYNDQTPPDTGGDRQTFR